MGERRTRVTGGTGTNTGFNTRYQNTRNSITGFCERSVADHLNKIESGFIEKYLKYMVSDEFVGMFFKEAPYKQIQTRAQYLQDMKEISTSLPENFRNSTQNFQARKSIDGSSNNIKSPVTENVFFAIRKYTIVEYFEEMRLLLNKFSNVQELLLQSVNCQSTIESGEIVIIECGVKLTNEKMKKLVSLKLEQVNQQLFIAGVEPKAGTKIHLIIFYNGDINFDFSIPEYDTLREHTTSNGQIIQVELHVAYISKLALLHHFAVKNRYHIDAIDDKFITVYELARFSLKQRQKQLHEQQSLKIKQEQQSQKQTSSTNTKSTQLPPSIPNKGKKEPNLRQRLRKSAENSFIFLKDRPIFSAFIFSAGAFSLGFLIQRIFKSKKQ